MEALIRIGKRALKTNVLVAIAAADFVGIFFLALRFPLIVIGAGLGIGKFAAAAAESIARQPGAADKITGAVNLPLFLLEGATILAEVFVLLIVFQ